MIMENVIKQLQKHWNKLSQREALAVIAGSIAALFMLWNAVIYGPYRENVSLLEQDIKLTNAKIAGVKAKLIEFRADMNKDPDIENRRLLEKYTEEGRRLDEELARASVQIIDVRDMVVLLREMLEKQSNLKFVSLENRPAVPEFIEKGELTETGSRDESAITIYRHSVLLEVEGSYASLLAYLQELEELSWQFFWQGIEIETETYPNAKITLEVYTLGLREGLIGV